MTVVVVHTECRTRTERRADSCGNDGRPTFDVVKRSAGLKYAAFAMFSVRALGLAYT